jgi:hypothetical protein
MGGIGRRDVLNSHPLTIRRHSPETKNKGMNGDKTGESIDDTGEQKILMTAEKTDELLEIYGIEISEHFVLHDLHRFEGGKLLAERTK